VPAATGSGAVCADGGGVEEVGGGVPEPLGMLSAWDVPDPTQHSHSGLSVGLGI